MRRTEALEPEEIRRVVSDAARSGARLRVHTRDGEVIVARILQHDDREVVYVAETSSRPERYAVCDATGFALAWEALARVQAL